MNEILSFNNVESTDASVENLMNIVNDQFEMTAATSEIELESCFGGTNDNQENEAPIQMPPQKRCVSHLLNRLSHDFEKKFLNSIAKKHCFLHLGNSIRYLC